MTSRPKGIKWSAEKRLGKISDSDLARALGVSPASVRNARVVRGIPSLFASGGAAKKGRGKGRNIAKRRASNMRWRAKRRREGRPVLSPAQWEAAKAGQRRRRQAAAAAKRAAKAKARDVLATWGVWADD